MNQHANTHPTLSQISAAQRGRTGHGRLTWLAAGVDAWLAWLERRDQIRQLQAMDEWQLKDIGVTRADVVREARGQR